MWIFSLPDPIEPGHATPESRDRRPRSELDRAVLDTGGVVVTDWQSTRVWRALLPTVNRLMRAWLRSGWHRPISSTMMVLTFEGVRSGRTYSFPGGYAEDPEGLVTFTRFSWWKNFREERPVSLRLRGREVREPRWR